jgi:hypothetical protein
MIITNNSVIDIEVMYTKNDNGTETKVIRGKPELEGKPIIVDIKDVKLETLVQIRQVSETPEKVGERTLTLKTKDSPTPFTLSFIHRGTGNTEGTNLNMGDDA